MNILETTEMYTLNKWYNELYFNKAIKRTNQTLENYKNTNLNNTYIKEKLQL